MKKWMLTVLLLAAVSVCAPAASLKISPEGKKEADLLMNFITGLYEQQKERPDAFEYYQKALELAPDSAYLKRQLVAAALTENKAELADEYADFITPESDGEDYAVYGTYLWKKGDTDGAAAAYEKALELAPDDTRMLYQYVLLLTYTDADKAVSKLEEQISEYPALAPAINMEIGNIYLSRKNYEEAVEYYNKATRLAPDYEMPYLGRAEAYEKMSQFFLMLREFEQLEKLDYGSAAMYSRMASVFLLSKDNARAEEYFLKAKKEDNSDAASAYFLAALAEQRGEYAKAIAYLKDASDYDTAPGKWLQVSFYLQRLNQPEESVRLLGEAYKKFDKSVEIGYFYALALQDQKQYKKAANVLKEVLRSNPGYDDARMAYAYTLESLKKYKDMEREVRLLLEKNPKNAAALNLLAYSLAERNIRLDEAKELAARALAVNPDDYSFMDTQAWIYYRAGQPEAAEDMLSAVPEEVISKHAEMAYHRGAVLFALGRYEQARSYLDLARSEIKDAAKLYKKLPAEK